MKPKEFAWEFGPKVPITPTHGVRFQSQCRSGGGGNGKCGGKCSK